MSLNVLSSSSKILDIVLEIILAWLKVLLSCSLKKLVFIVSYTKIFMTNNAVKYTESGGKVEVSLFKKGQYAVIKISDNGIGIAEENLSYIFERFYRADSARSRQTGGSGLGLSISQQIISLHQGRIEVESTVNEGTTFYVVLPVEYMLGEKD